MDTNKLTKDEVKHIANLSKLNLTDKEISEFQNQLSETLEYIEDLNEIDTKDLEAKNQVTGLINVVAEDIPEPSLSVEDATKNSSHISNNLFKVKAIFE